MRCQLLPPEYLAVRHILESPLLARVSAGCVGEDDFDWTGLFTAALTMSSGERLLLRITHDLWTARRDVRIAEIARGLDAQGFELVLQAMRMCRVTVLDALDEVA